MQHVSKKRKECNTYQKLKTDCMSYSKLIAWWYSNRLHDSR